MTVYMDTSSLVKLFVEEPESDDVRALVEGASAVFTAQVAYPETRAALARRRREHSFSKNQFAVAENQFEAKWADVLAMTVTKDLCHEAGDFAERYHLRGFDSIHLASFAEMLRGLQGNDDVRFSSCDDRLNRAARHVARTIR